jgi:beta-phosphoglucomutase-like phosphatase (HAD superfamily)
MSRLAEYLNPEQAAAYVQRRAAEQGVAEFVAVRNLEYVFSPAAVYPLAPRVLPPLERIVALAVDMDGTSTTTEPLALHALEYMVRRFTGRPTKAQWPGLDPVADYPHVIGNSNVRHAEFLLERYRPALKHDALRQAFIEALAWTLACMDDPARRRGVTHDARQCGLGALLDDPDFQRLVRGGELVEDNVAERVAPFVKRHGDRFEYAHSGPLAAAALDIYYMRYHAILRAIEQGRGAALSRELLGAGDRRLIEPMPGYDLFLPMVKGWLDPEHGELFDWLANQPQYATRGDTFARLAGRFRQHPAKLALVTASIRYEAETTMKEVLSIVAERIRAWPLPPAFRDDLAQRVADPAAVFDAFICAADACEHRLKPHPDLYSLALERMSIPKTEYRRCVGLEDTEPGVIALRAAGVGCAIAVPNHDTNLQDYRAASLTLRGGLPELIVRHNLLLA